MNNIRFITFYTSDEYYTLTYNTYLKPSLDKWELPHFVTKVATTKRWETNTLLKPKMILGAMYMFPNTDIVWIDADATIEQYPSLLFKIAKDNYDIALNWLSWEEHYGRPSDKGKFEMLDGTIYIKNSAKMRTFIRQWQTETTDKGINHQRPLEQMLRKRKDIILRTLPREYSYIATKPDGSQPNIPLDNPVIVHYQCSRGARGKIL